MIANIRATKSQNVNSQSQKKKQFDLKVEGLVIFVHTQKFNLQV